MKALVKRHGKPGLWLEEVPQPEIGINDVLIRIDRTGIRQDRIECHEVAVDVRQDRDPHGRSA